VEFIETESRMMVRGGFKGAGLERWWRSKSTKFQLESMNKCKRAITQYGNDS
jgi:hypothetical protein